MREHLNHVIDETDHPPVMHVTSAPGLSELAGHERMVPTHPLHALGRLSKTITSGSIGVSGPRGAGKSTLLRYFSDPSFASETDESRVVFTPFDLRFMVSAPVTYQQRDFILHVFGKLCAEVIRFEEAHQPDWKWRASQRLRRTTLAVATAALAGTTFTVPPSDWPRSLGSLQVWTVATATVAVLAVIRALVFWWPQQGLQPDAHGNLLQEAKYWQETIRYARSFIAGSSGSLGLPRALQIGMSSSRQVSEIPLTVPELVEAMRDFAARAIRERQAFFASLLPKEPPDPRLRDIRSSRLVHLSEVKELARREMAGHRPRMIIGIDEIDKMDADSAQRFLNEIKSIFGMPDCLYLVSVSDEALAVYEKRVLLGRTAFDSAFDEFIRVRPLDYEFCKRLLRQRIAGIPETVIAFCHVMSGGVPRDTIRTARAVLNVREQGKEQIDDIVLGVITDQMDVLTRACIEEIAASATSARGFPSTALKPGWPGRTAEEMIATLADTDMSGTLPFSFRTAIYFYATVAETFATRLSETARLLRTQRSAGSPGIDDLAQARNSISVNPAAAWQMIGHFRSVSLDLSRC